MIQGMKKLFILFLAVALSAIALASPTGNKMGEQRDVLIMSKNQSVNQGRPRAPELTLFNACNDNYTWDIWTVTYTL